MRGVREFRHPTVRSIIYALVRAAVAVTKLLMLSSVSLWASIINLRAVFVMVLTRVNFGSVQQITGAAENAHVGTAYNCTIKH